VSELGPCPSDRLVHVDRPRPRRPSSSHVDRLVPRRPRGFSTVSHRLHRAHRGVHHGWGRLVGALRPRRRPSSASGWAAGESVRRPRRPQRGRRFGPRRRNVPRSVAGARPRWPQRRHPAHAPGAPRRRATSAALALGLPCRRSSAWAARAGRFICFRRPRARDPGSRASSSLTCGHGVPHGGPRVSGLILELGRSSRFTRSHVGVHCVPVRKPPHGDREGRCCGSPSTICSCSACDTSAGRKSVLVGGPLHYPIDYRKQGLSSSGGTSGAMWWGVVSRAARATSTVGMSGPATWRAKRPVPETRPPRAVHGPRPRCRTRRAIASKSGGPSDRRRRSVSPRCFWSKRSIP